MDQAHRDEPASEQDFAEFLPCMVEKVRDYAIFIMDATGTIRSWNKAAEAMKGYTSEDTIGSFLGLLYTEEDRKNGRPQHNLDIAAKNGTYQEESWRQKKDGSLFWAMIEIIAIKKKNGELKGFCKITRDITAGKSLQDQLTREKERAQVTLGAIGDAVISVDQNSHVDYLNAKAEQMTGWSLADALDRPFAEVFHAIDEATGEPQEHQLIAWLQRGQILQRSYSAVLISRDGTQYAIEDTAAAIRLPDGNIPGGVIVFRDVTESRQIFKTTTYQATHDTLTGLVNRLEFDNRLQRSLDRASKGHTTGAVLYMDLDQFKIVNDVCGHHAGDELLKQLARLYRTVLRERDTLSRLGGDEFGVIADHCSSEEAFAIANKILQSTRTFQFVCKDRTFSVGVSIGLVMFDGTINDKNMIVQQADHACYVAKEKGRNQIYHQLPSESASLQRKDDIDWVSRLNDAIRNNHLQLHLQPIADVNGGNRSRYEVLLRLQTPGEGLVLPERFLPAAERYSLMPVIDRWVVRRVLTWMEENLDQAEKLDFCSINLAPTTAMDGTFLADLGTLLGEYRIAAEKLCFEITETAVLTDIRKSLAMVGGLRALGCKVALDSFGKGMGSFAHLKRLSADFVKLDPSLIARMTNDTIDAEVVKSVNDIVHVMGAETIAQGVEDQATVDALARIGIDYIQGHWIASPVALGSSLH